MLFIKNIRSLLVGIAVIAILVLTFVIIEFYESRKELLNTLKNESVNLSESLSLSFENTLITNEEIETQIINRLDAVAALVAHLELPKKNDNKSINDLLKKFQIDYIFILNKKGRVLISSDSLTITKQISNEFISEMKPLFSGSEEFVDFGIVKNEINNKDMYLVGRKSTNKNKCVLVGLSSEKMLSFRKKVGIGKQIQEIADNPDIIYILLQDNEGIISASKGLKDMTSIEVDTFLKEAYNSFGTKTRLVDYEGKKVFESVKSVMLSDGSKMLNRIGLSLDNIRAIQQRSMRRVILIGIGIFILFTVLYLFLMTRRGFSDLKKEHKIIQSYTDLVLENMADAVIAVNKNNLITFFNKPASRIFDLSFDEAIGQDYNKIFTDDLLLINYSKENRQTFTNKDITFTNSMNSNRNLELSLSFVFDSNNFIDLTIAILKDLTDKKNLQQQIERKEKLSAMGELAAGVAHEIRNPLNSINIITQRIQKEFEPKADIEDYQSLLSTVRTEVIRVNNIIKQFLEYARPPKLQIGKFSINEVLDESISVIESEAKLEQILIKKDFQENVLLDIDKAKMKQVFINLLRNSIDSITATGLISCSIKLNGNKAEIQIADNGSGISDEIKTKIFNLYFTTKQFGTGLGLSIVHQIVSEHNGYLEVESQEGKGTNFKIILPVTPINISTNVS